MLSFMVPDDPTDPTLKEGESWAEAKPRRVTSENSFLSPDDGGLVEGGALLPNALRGNRKLIRSLYDNNVRYKFIHLTKLRLVLKIQTTANTSKSMRRPSIRMSSQIGQKELLDQFKFTFFISCNILYRP